MKRVRVLILGSMLVFQLHVLYISIAVKNLSILYKDSVIVAEE
jgi:hypothetical protein